MAALALAPKSCGSTKHDDNTGGSAAPVAAVRKATSPDAAAPPVAPVTPDAAELPIEVTAKQLFADYEANEVSADDKYRGKPLLVTGVIKKISKDAFDKPYVQLLAGDRYGINDVWARFTDESALGKLKKGQKLVVRCTGKGMTLTTPALVDCTIEHLYEWVPAK